MLETLHKLINALHPPARARSIIAAFQSVLNDQSESGQRTAVLEYWLDFYRLQHYRQRRKRRRATVKERLTPCSACGYPVSHRHHLWTVEAHGENAVTIQLCANCHELYHLLYNALVHDSEYSRTVALHALNAPALNAETLSRIMGWCLAVIRYEADNGWIDGNTGSKQAVETKFNWTAVLQQKQSAQSG
ncbi:MAG: hypothetical protein NZM00_12060 [Anaerolinea sp.]|nr:hypothetical protein [Anaerolinea sp.]